MDAGVTARADTGLSAVCAGDIGDVAVVCVSSDMMKVLLIPVHLALLLAMPPLLLGVINRTKAVFAGRTGQPLLQPYYDLARLMRKGMVFSTTTTWVFRVAPLVTLVAVVAAGLLVPMGPFDAPVHFGGDLILFAYLFGLARFFTTSAAMDTGSAF